MSTKRQTTKQQASPAEPFDYMALRRELDDILAQLQSAEVDIDASMAAYTRGADIVAQLEDHLKTVEHMVVPLKSEADNSQED